DEPIRSPGSAGLCASLLNTNGDAHPDVAIASSSATALLLGNGDGTVGSPVSYSGGEMHDSIVTGDFDGDGEEAVALSCCDSVCVKPSLGNGTLAPFHDRYLVDGEVDSLIGADLNGDGATDLAAVALRHVGAGTVVTLVILLGQGNGSFVNAASYSLPS